MIFNPRVRNEKKKELIVRFNDIYRIDIIQYDLGGKTKLTGLNLKKKTYF